jgi:hypothetical protein
MNRIEKKEMAPQAARLFEEEVLHCDRPKKLIFA